MKGCQQINGQPGYGLRLGMTGKLLFDKPDYLVPVSPLAFSLLRVAAEDIPSSALTVTYNDLLGVQVVPDDMIPAALSKHLMLHLRNGCHAGGQQVLSA